MTHIDNVRWNNILKFGVLVDKIMIFNSLAFIRRKIFFFSKFFFKKTLVYVYIMIEELYSRVNDINLFLFCS